MPPRWHPMRTSSFVLPIFLMACQERGAAPGPSPEPTLSDALTAGETRGRIALGKDAAAIMRSGARVPVVLPPGFTIYPGAKVTGNTLIEQDDGWRALVEFETPDPVAKVLLFHRAQAEAAGVSLTLDLAGPKAASIGGRTAAGGDFALTAR